MSAYEQFRYISAWLILWAYQHLMHKLLLLVHSITLQKLIWTADWSLLVRDGDFLRYNNAKEILVRILLFYILTLKWFYSLPSNLRAIDRLLKVIKTPHPVPEVCRKAAMILESLVSEPQNRVLLLAYENAFAEILFSDGRYSDTFARILYELTSRPNNKVASARGIWGCGWTSAPFIYFARACKSILIGFIYTSVNVLLYILAEVKLSSLKNHFLFYLMGNLKL